jgi:hypothetical protein
MEVRYFYMRRYLLSGVVAVLIVIASPSTSQSNPGEENIERPFAVQQLISQSTGLRDEAAMVLVGGCLLVLAALVRRAA